MAKFKPNICLIGDSTMLTCDEYLSLMTKGNVTNLAIFGGNTAGQVAQWNALTTEQKLSFDYVLIQIGLNDLGTGGKTALQLIPEIQDLFNLVIAEKSATCKTISSTMTPCRGTIGDTAYGYWLTVNESYRGEGDAPFIADLYCSYHTAKLNDGDGYLNETYNSGDDVHANLAGREVCADDYRGVIDFIYYQ